MTQSRIDLLFAKGHLPVRLPAETRPTVIRKGAMPKLPEPRAAIAESLANPVLGDSFGNQPGRFHPGGCCRD